jgi:hypothetical protein
VTLAQEGRGRHLRRWQTELMERIYLRRGVGAAPDLAFFYCTNVKSHTISLRRDRNYRVAKVRCARPRGHFFWQLRRSFGWESGVD